MVQIKLAAEQFFSDQKCVLFPFQMILEISDKLVLFEWCVFHTNSDWHRIVRVILFVGQQNPIPIGILRMSGTSRRQFSVRYLKKKIYSAATFSSKCAQNLLFVENNLTNFSNRVYIRKKQFEKNLMQTPSLIRK